MIEGNFENVNVGEKVIYIQNGFSTIKMRITEVSEVKKRTFKVNGDLNIYRKADGCVYGNSLSNVQIYPYNEKNLEEYNNLLLDIQTRERRKTLLHNITNFPFKELDNEALEDIYSTIAKYTNKGE